VVSHRFPFEKAAEAYQRFDKKVGGIEKIYLEVGIRLISFISYRIEKESSRHLMIVVIGQTRFSAPRAAGPELQTDVWADTTK
jgi:hypothetical protein